MRKDEYSVHLGMHGLKIRKKGILGKVAFSEIPCIFFFYFQFARKKYETRVAVNGSSYCFKFFYFEEI